MDDGDYDNFDSSFEDEECDAQSLASLQNDDDIDFSPEKILAERYLRGNVWYLIKWENCPVVRSSWEIKSLLVLDNKYKKVLDDWEEEKILHIQGKKEPFDVNAFIDAVNETEQLEKGRRNLRRWKRQVKGILSAITASKVD